MRNYFDDKGGIDDWPISQWPSLGETLAFVAIVILFYLIWMVTP